MSGARRSPYIFRVLAAKFVVPCCSAARLSRLRGEGTWSNETLHQALATAPQRVSHDLPGDHRLAFALKQELAAFRIGKFRRNPSIGFVRYENFPGCRLA